MRCRLLGTLEISDERNVYRPGGPKMRQVLALLLSSANTVVSTDSIIDELWADDPPRSVSTTVQTYIYQLRRALDREFPDEQLGSALVTRAPGYKLSVPESHIDANSFEYLAAGGRTLFCAGRAAEALDRLRAALELWEGDVLANVPRGRRLHNYAVQLDELKIETLQMKITAEMCLGRHRELISELRTLAENHPLNEWFYGQLMCALTRAGRRGEALNTYQRLRKILDDELGLEPSEELKSFQLDILRGGDGYRGGTTSGRSMLEGGQSFLGSLVLQLNPQGSQWG